MSSETLPSGAPAAVIAADPQQLRRGEDRGVAIRVNGLVKDYRLYSHPFDLLKEFLLGGTRHRSFRALDAIDLEVREGEIVGLIGRNGAGKSTLLKVITGVLDYDKGSVEVDGKVSAILELGSGFNPEYTGRENVYFDAICMGMKRSEILAKMDGIIEFAELDAVIDQPFKTYSSGMKARLAFATAISADANILIIDEALSVGDALFQQKCFQRLEQIAAGGRTVFFVTHSLGQIYTLCNRALLLHQGRILADGAPREVGYQYEHLLARARAEALIGATDRPHLEPDAKLAQLKAYVASLDVRDSSGIPVTELHHGEQYTVRLVAKFNNDVSKFGVGFRLETPGGTVVTSAATALSGVVLSARRGEAFEVCFSFVSQLGTGQLILSGGISELCGPSFVPLDIPRSAQVLTVIGSETSGGLFDLRPRIDVRQLDERSVRT